MKRPSVGRIVFWGIALVLGFGAFYLTQSVITCWKLTNLPGIPPSSCTGETLNPLSTPYINEQGTVVAPEALPTPLPPMVDVLPPAWDGASRINILFIGLDYRDWQANEGPPRSDTMLLFTVDPVTKTAGMLSIPRDMWVNIPGFGYSRINTAYSSGTNLPGGGPGLAMKTVEQFIGVPVNYYVQVDFGTFTGLVDYLGGLDVYVEQDVEVDLVGPGYDDVGRLAANDQVTIVGRNTNSRFLQIEYAAGPEGKGWVLTNAVQADGIDALPITSTGEAPGSGIPGVILKATQVRPAPGNPNHVKITCCGYRHMNGDIALAFARARHTEGGDVDRAKRQQQVIFALQKKIFDPAVFPGLISQAPALYNQFSSGIHTNMSLEDAIRLAVLGKDISRSSIRTGVIDTSMVTLDSAILSDGTRASILKPISDKIRVLRDEIFTTSGPVSALASGDPRALMQQEEARVRIVDGTFTGLETRAATFFQSQGMNVTEVGPASDAYSSTVIVV
ncbi:MAG: LCP family protein, partial [Chloroflexota bacterium]